MEFSSAMFSEHFLFSVFHVIIITNSDDGWVHFSAERFVPDLLPILKKYPIVSARTRYEHFYPNQPLCWKAAAFAHEVNEIFYSNVEQQQQHMSNTPEASTQSVLIDKADNNSCSDSLESTDVSSAESNACSDGNNSNIDSIDDDMMIVEEDATAPPTQRQKHHYQGNQHMHQQQREIISFGDSIEERTAVRIVSNQLIAVSKSVMFIQTPNPIQIIGQLMMLTSHMKYICEQCNSTVDLEISIDQAERYATKYMQKYVLDYDLILNNLPHPDMITKPSTASTSTPPSVLEVKEEKKQALLVES